MMSDWPTTLLPPLPTICTQSFESLGMLTMGALPGTAPGTGTMVQNLAHFVPFRLDIGATAVKLCYIVGGTQNGNVDMGIYDAEFNLLVSSGATAQAAANTLQELDITDTPLRPGNYWMAISSSSATGTFVQSQPADEIGLPGLPLYVQASAHPLPDPATPTKELTSPRICIGMAVSFDTLI